MRQPTPKAIFFFLGILGVGYAIGFPVMTGILQIPVSLTSFLNLSAFAFLFAVVMTLWLDQPMELELIQWPEKKPKITQRRADETIEPVAVVIPPAPAKVEVQEAGPGFYPRGNSGSLFPHERPEEHWDVDFGDGKQVYQGSELPVWILAGWAVFIIWAVVYLVSGLPTAF